MKKDELIKSVEYWDTNYKIDLYQLVEKFMLENNMNRTQLANYLGVTKGYISQLLNGNYNHKMSKFFELCLAFGVAPVIHYVPLDEFVKKETMILKSKAKKRSVV
jgi:transcriptional regulator with XRE-family HTH domain